MLNLESKLPVYSQLTFSFSLFIRLLSYFFFFLLFDNGFQLDVSFDSKTLIFALCSSFSILVIERFFYLPYQKTNANFVLLFKYFPLFLFFQGFLNFKDFNILYYVEAIFLVYLLENYNFKLYRMDAYICLMLVFSFALLPGYLKVNVFAYFLLYIFFDKHKLQKSFFTMISFTFLCFGLWGYEIFGLCQVDQILAILQFGKSGVFTGDLELYFGFINKVMILPFVLFYFFILIRDSYPKILSNEMDNISIIKSMLAIAYVCYLSGAYIFIENLWLLLKSQFTFMVFAYLGIGFLFIYFLRRYFSRFLSLGFFLFAIYVLNVEFQFSSYLYPLLSSSNFTRDYFKDAYKDPKQVHFQMAKKPKSLILIYVESLESAYQDKNLFKKDLLHDLNNLNYAKINFSEFTQVSNTGWSMAGVLASQCGVPFKLLPSFYGSNNIGRHLKHFMRNGFCLGDILHQYGYQNIYLNGSSLDFAGFGSFFKSHHYDELYGRSEWAKKGYNSGQLNFWGLPDDLLFTEAKRKLTMLMQQSKLFNLTMFTIDMHGPKGRLSETCIKRGGKSFEDIVECESSQVAHFIDYVAQQGWLNRVTIIVIGDHLAMQNPVSFKLAQSPTHYIYNLIITNKQLKKSRDNIVHFDLFPTILHALGFKWDNDKLGLGYSALGEINPKLSPKKRIDQLEKIILSHSNTYNNLWLRD